MHLPEILAIRAVNKSFINIVYNYGNSLLYKTDIELNTPFRGLLHKPYDNMKLMSAVFKNGPDIKYNHDNILVGYYPIRYGQYNKRIPLDRTIKKEFKLLNVFCNDIDDYDYSNDDWEEHFHLL